MYIPIINVKAQENKPTRRTVDNGHSNYHVASTWLLIGEEQLLASNCLTDFVRCNRLPVRDQLQTLRRAGDEDQTDLIKNNQLMQIGQGCRQPGIAEKH